MNSNDTHIQFCKRYRKLKKFISNNSFDQNVHRLLFDMTTQLLANCHKVYLKTPEIITCLNQITSISIDDAGRTFGPNVWFNHYAAEPYLVKLEELASSS
jgi:hypothetical protein